MICIGVVTRGSVIDGRYRGSCQGSESGCSMRNRSSPRRDPRGRNVSGIPTRWRGPIIAYFITWTTYGTWLPGDARGSVGTNNIPGHPYDLSDPQRYASARENMASEPFLLSSTQRAFVEKVLREHSEFRGWRLHAVNVRSNHVHLVISSNAPPEEVMGKLKSRVSRKLHEAGVASEQRIWTRHGSTRYLDSPVSLQRAIEYVLYEQ